MVTFSLHLDITSEQNGDLKVIPSSHSYGISSQERIHDVTQNEQPFSCEV